jgi:hypothetical protein
MEADVQGDEFGSRLTSEDDDQGGAAADPLSVYEKAETARDEARELAARDQRIAEFRRQEREAVHSQILGMAPTALKDYARELLRSRPDISVEDARQALKAEHARGAVFHAIGGSRTDATDATDEIMGLVAKACGASASDLKGGSAVLPTAIGQKKSPKPGPTLKEIIDSAVADAAANKGPLGL